MKEFLQQILSDIRAGKNIDVYVAIAINAILAVISLLGLLSPPILGAALLASLSWLTLNVLIARRDNVQQTSTIIHRLETSSKTVRAADFFSENYVYNSNTFQAAFRSARTLHVIGMGQGRMITAYGGQIRRILAEGGKVQFILGDPEGTGTEMAVKRGSTQQRVSRVRQEHWGAAERLNSYCKGPSCTGQLLIKFVDQLMPYTLYGFDLSEPSKAKIFVWITVFQESSETRPGFLLTSLQDPHWFAYFQKQFERLWNWEEAKLYEGSSFTSDTTS